EDLHRHADLAWWQKRLDSVRGSSSLAPGEARPAPHALRVASSLDEALQARVLATARRLGRAWTDVVTAALGSYLARMLPPDEGRARIGVPMMDRVDPDGGVRACAHTVC